MTLYEPLLPNPRREPWKLRWKSTWRSTWKYVLAIILVIAAFVYGFHEGWHARDKSFARDCAQIFADGRKLDEAIGLEVPGSPAQRVAARAAIYVVLKNPGCYSTGQVATAQAQLDEINRH
ncbi:hypothetical protein [Microtetraspora malaysiensis]|uniref:DUF4129 domain-containing protein n=1 Tax=Microtetraspora malaysiensis TaxID=161358 RepID=A0ABW6T4W6_9ACTN